MRLSAPIYRLKREAKRLSRTDAIPLHDALDRIAAREGFASWSLLMSKVSPVIPAGRLFAQLTPGDLVLIGARPGHGKTLMGLKLAVEATKRGHRSAFFTLEYTEKDVIDRLRAIGVDHAALKGLFEFDNSDDINADYIAAKLAAAPRGTLVIVDYLQLLDQKRQNPELSIQLRVLQLFARLNGLILVFISQIDRAYDPLVKACPDLDDVRLPNPVDRTLFTKTCFMNNGDVRIRASG